MTLTMTDIRVREIDNENLPLTDLEHALLNAGVKILNQDSVREYQARKLEEVKARLKSPLQNRRLALGAVLLLSAGLTGAVLLFRSAPLFSAVPLMIAVGLTRILASLAVRSSRLVEWRSYSVGCCWGGHLHLLPIVRAPGVEFTTPVPVEARIICESIAGTKASFSFEVEQLDDDPFLKVLNGSEHYYLLGWDEQGFIPT